MNERPAQPAHPGTNSRTVIGLGQRAAVAAGVVCTLVVGLLWRAGVLDRFELSPSTSGRAGSTTGGRGVAGRRVIGIDNGADSEAIERPGWEVIAEATAAWRARGRLPDTAGAPIRRRTVRVDGDAVLAGRRGAHGIILRWPPDRVRWGMASWQLIAIVPAGAAGAAGG